MSDEAESSGQALERFMKEQFTVLAIEVPEDDLEMMARFVEEEGLEKDEKVEGVRAMIEGFVDPLPENIDHALESIVDEYDRLKALEQAALEEEQSSSSSEDEDTGKRGNILDTLTPEELKQAQKQAQKQALLRQYAYVDADPDDLAIAGLTLEGRDPNAPAKSAKEKEGEREKEERRKAIEEALRLDGKKKKHRKNKEVDLLAPNLNKEKMLYKAQMERDAQKSTAQMKKERDKAALDKQRADAAAAKVAKQKKAAKGERRA